MSLNFCIEPFKSKKIQWKKKKAVPRLFTDFQRGSWLAKCRTVSRYTDKNNLICAHRKNTVVLASAVTNPINTQHLLLYQLLHKSEINVGSVGSN